MLVRHNSDKTITDSLASWSYDQLQGGYPSLSFNLHHPLRSPAMSLKMDRASMAFTFKGGMLPMTVMELTSADPERIRDQLESKLKEKDIISA